MRLDRDWAGDQIETVFREIVRAGTKKRPLGNAAVIADGDLRQAQDQNVFANPAVVSNGQSPWVGDVDAGADDNALAYFGTKALERKNT